MQKIYTANIIIQNNNKEILLVKRATSKDYGGFWSLPGGGKEKKEKIVDTLRREIKEELGQEINNYHFFRKYKIDFCNKVVIAHYFFGEVGNLIKIDKKEVSEYRWFSIGQIPENLAFCQNKVIEDFIKNGI